MDLGSIAQVFRRETPGALGVGRSASSLEKLTIQYERGKTGRFGGRVEALFNPNAFTLAYQVDWETRKAALPGLGYHLGFTGSSYTPPTLTLELFFDTYETGDGAAPSSTSVTTHTEQIVNLLRIDSELHRPPICRLLWGKLQLFQGVLTSLSQSFSLFQPDGTPVRATLNCTFTLHRSTTLAMKALDLHSADVPKTRTVRGGDTLSGIAAEEYGDPAAWRTLATANGLANPRVLVPGQVLRIPKLVDP